MFALAVLASAAFSPMALGRPLCQPRVLGCQPRMLSVETLGYQTEASGSARFVQSQGLADEISLLRAAVARCTSEKDLDAQRTLLLQCQMVQHRLKGNLKSLREQETEVKVLLRSVDGLLRQGGRIYNSDFDVQLAELKRELK